MEVAVDSNHYDGSELLAVSSNVAALTIEQEIKRQLRKVAESMKASRDHLAVLREKCLQGHGDRLESATLESSQRSLRSRGISIENEIVYKGVVSCVGQDVVTAKVD